MHGRRTFVYPKVTFAKPEVTATIVLPQADRIAIWEQFARDRVRFRTLIEQIDGVLTPVLLKRLPPQNSCDIVKS